MADQRFGYGKKRKIHPGVMVFLAWAIVLAACIAVRVYFKGN